MLRLKILTGDLNSLPKDNSVSSGAEEVTDQNSMPTEKYQQYGEYLKTVIESWE